MQPSYTPRYRVEQFADMLEVPSQGDTILLKAMQAQRAAVASCRDKFADEESEEQLKADRQKMIHLQIERRQALDTKNVRSADHMQDMLEQLTMAVRERQTTLRTEGYQTYVFPNDDVYEGEWKNCRMHGRGVLRRTAENELYEGEWFLGVQNGVGTMQSGNEKTMYSGKWVDGRRNGRGELIEPEGMYTGEFLDGRIHGVGEYVYTDGHIYKGEWVDERYEGNGTYLYPSGAKYEGTWKRGRENGRGSKTYRNGDTYIGEWHHGRMHGSGLYTGSVMTYEGEFRYGTMCGSGTAKYHNGSAYVGEWSKGKYHGEGVFTDPTTDIRYQGEWHNGKRHGQGQYTSANESYIGEWKADKKHGLGQLTFPGKGLFKGQWANDLPEGDGVYSGGIEGSNVVCYSHGVCTVKDEKEVYKRVSVALDPREL